MIHKVIKASSLINNCIDLCKLAASSSDHMRNKNAFFYPWSAGRGNRVTLLWLIPKHLLDISLHSRHWLMRGVHENRARNEMSVTMVTLTFITDDHISYADDHRPAQTSFCIMFLLLNTLKLSCPNKLIPHANIRKCPFIPGPLIIKTIQVISDVCINSENKIFSKNPRPKWSVPAVYTAGTLQPMQCTCSTLHIHCQQVAVYLQCTCSLHCSYTACTLHFGLGWQIPALMRTRFKWIENIMKFCSASLILICLNN